MRALRALLPLLLLSGMLLSGCLGGEKRTEWAFEAAGFHGTGRTGAGVTVAVLDTGVNVRHPALDHLVDGDLGDGELVAFRDYIEGRDGVENAYDPDGHGSHVVGIISGRGSRLTDKLSYGGVDLLGAAPSVRLVVARVCTSETCKAESIPQAIDWAVRSQRADVISLSLGGPAGVGLLEGVIEDALEAAVNRALDAGVVVVAAAGNDGARGDDVATPSDVPGVIAVGAIGPDRRVADFSNRGSAQRNTCPTLPLPGMQGRCDPDRKPELVAPGVRILSAWSGDKYVEASGTSQAVPFVTAAVALMLEGKPDLNGRTDVQRVKQALVSTAQPVEGQVRPHDRAAGYGIVHAAQAVQRFA